MSKPRIFISSTYYDLKHVRSSLDIFVESLGFEAILSEKGNITYMPDVPLDESCYREAVSVDIFVLIIGGRYGSEVGGQEKKPSYDFFERYNSITKKEFESAIARDIPVYILIDTNVYSEYQTYLKNKESNDITYAHVDSINVFKLIEEVLAKPRNNPVHTFDKFSELNEWLREQWAGLFRELLQKRSQQQQLTTLSSQVGELREVIDTLKRYLEAVMTGITPDASTKLIQSEQRRLAEVEIKEKLRTSKWFKFIQDSFEGISLEDFESAFFKSKNIPDFLMNINSVSQRKKGIIGMAESLVKMDSAKSEFNELRELMGLKQITPTESTEESQSDGVLDRQ